MELNYIMVRSNLSKKRSGLTFWIGEQNCDLLNEVCLLSKAVYTSGCESTHKTHDEDIKMASLSDNNMNVTLH